ncbi:isoprenylcysteine carboxylmethyltransferase family protein [Lachnoanaerobaculum gingivalis]|uniref:methyltransferase family protein n=1 Tax=Lachnoanaerobaculum gingivalis TaxID=2490855 RepID=UPI0028D01BAC|nr:isoprenylcysteine carboxylmethyltransferase family protein [Lachnoanaerobaculum gingivalis]
MKKNTLPVFGVGPIYAVICLLLTAFGLFLKKKGFLDSGDLPGLKSVAMAIGGLLIFIGVALWIYAVLIQRISKEISSGHLVTIGIYSIVRNPIYLAFLCVCTGILVTAHNVYLLIFPIIFYIFLTVLMKQTEEKWLLEKFGTEYAEYCKHVNRVIPWFRH